MATLPNFPPFKVPLLNKGGVLVREWMDFFTSLTGQAAAAGTGTVTAVTGAAPIASSGGTTPAISLNNSGVSAGTYGDATHVPQVTLTAKGIVSAVTNVAISGSGGIDQLTGDVTAGPGSGSQAATIANNAVTYAKMQDVSAASKMLGRGSASGSGDVEEITLGTNLSMSGTTLNATGGGGGGGWVLLETQTATAATALNFTSWYSSTYDEYIIEIINLTWSGADSPALRMSTDGGSSYDSGTNYDSVLGYGLIGGAGGIGAVSTTSMNFRTSGATTLASNGSWTGNLRLMNPASAIYKTCYGQHAWYDNPTGVIVGQYLGLYKSTSAVNAFRFLLLSGTAFNGIFRVYGVTK